MQRGVTALLRAYHHDALLLFLGASFLTIAVVPAGFSLIRRRIDPLLLFRLFLLVFMASGFALIQKCDLTVIVRDFLASAGVIIETATNVAW